MDQTDVGNLVFQQKKVTIKETPTSMKYWFPNVGLRVLGQRPIPNDKNKPNCEAIILTYFRFGTKKGNNLKYLLRFKFACVRIQRQKILKS